MKQEFIGEEFDILNQMKKAISELDKQAKIEAENKLLGTPLEKLLPEIYEDSRILPNVFLRGGLFGMVKKGKRALVGDMPIFSMSQYEVKFTGYELDQNDLELWDTLLYLAKQRGVDTELRISLYDLCKQMEITDAKNNYDRLINRAKRLALGKVSIKSNTKEYFGSLLDDVYIDTYDNRKLIIRYNKKLMPLFRDKDYTFIDMRMRHQLGDSQLARWLYNFYESHKEPIPFKLEYIQQLCRSQNTMKDFKYKIKIAIEQVKQAYIIVDPNSKWDYEINNKNYLIIYPKGKTEIEIKLPKFEYKTF